METHSSNLAWEIPWSEELGRLQSMGPQRVGCVGSQFPDRGLNTCPCTAGGFPTAGPPEESWSFTPDLSISTICFAHGCLIEIPKTQL